MATSRATRPADHVTTHRVRRRPHASAAGAALTVGALGVVFGDIGTSPLYTLQALFAGHRLAVGEPQVLGVLSLILWTLTLVVSVKYLTLVMRADHDGEGGMMALIGRVEALRLSRRKRLGLAAAGVFGVSLFLGDGMITPAISVLSAVQGLEVAAPGVASLVVPLTVGILVALFAVQRFGTGAVGGSFGPLMVVWFAVIGVMGLAEVAAHPGVLRAVSPTYAVALLADRPATAFGTLGFVVLAVTGAEALFADMGHFGRPPIRRAWFALVFPALALNYLGQGALLLHRPSAVVNPFFLLAPSWGRTLLVGLAAAATVIASQALISGAFSLSRQAVRLGYLPRLKIHHTSERLAGQVYVPALNALLLVGVVGTVLGFRSASRLASAYGVAVTGTFVITSVLFLAIARHSMGWSRRRTWAAGTALLTVDGAFFAANLTKLPSGGWLPVVIAVAAFILLTTWHDGAQVARASRLREAGDLQAFVDVLDAQDPPLPRLPGTAVFLGADVAGTPLALKEHVQHTHALHEAVIVLVVLTESRAHVPLDERVAIDSLGDLHDGIVEVTARYGYKDRVDVPACLGLARDKGLSLDVSDPSYYVSRMSLKRTDVPGMAAWRKRLFVRMARNATDPIDYFALPDDRVVTLGARVAI